MTHVTIIGTVTAKPETRDELQAVLSAQVAPTRAEPGCLNYDFHVDAVDPCCFVFYENWQTQADLDKHMAMPHLTPLLSQLDRLLARPVDIRALKMLSDMSGQT
ncbi:putative quinol monooxygenase [Loktanella sp. SALINAS62]|uniref:putative quinol monooxygenase n=1 Tax=Loktanella sp. SALINAS62 TaxID=2706124 RepID=UPI001B8CFFC0|nr:putative quinol monooxygenase [Loktanella sp. SALINAS62]MBS1303470.1 antibiotic biosynthesis monooxygenase [Loktanella sp. SALINAS62]